MSTFTGYLKHLRKEELKAIADALGLPSDTNRNDLEDSIRKKLQDDPKLYADPRFRNISGVHVQKRPPSEKSDGPTVKSTVTTPTAAINAVSSKARRSSMSNGPLVKQAKETLQNAAEQAEQVPRRLKTVSNQLVSSANLQLAITKRLDNSQIIKAVTLWTQRAELQLGEGARKAQTTLSDGWVVILLTVAFELLFVLVASIPVNKEIIIGPFEWWSKSWIPDSLLTVTLPNVLVLRQCSVSKPILLWLATTVVVPFIASHFIVFPKPRSQEGRRFKHHHNYFLGLTPPSALTFSIVRLALDVYLTRLTEKPLISFSTDILHRFGNLQVLASSVALAFTAYELLADH